MAPVTASIIVERASSLLGFMRAPPGGRYDLYFGLRNATNYDILWPNLGELRNGLSTTYIHTKVCSKNEL